MDIPFSPWSVNLHETEIISFDINKDTISFHLRWNNSIYFWNEEQVRDIFKDPENNYLIVDLVFKGVQIDHVLLSSDFVLNEDLDITNNDYDEKTKIFTIGIEDSYLHYMDLFFRFESYEWIYIDEIPREG